MISEPLAVREQQTKSPRKLYQETFAQRRGPVAWGHNDSVVINMDEPSPRILVADDDPEMREMLAEELRASGYEVLLAKDGAQLREMLHGKGINRIDPEPDLVVSDIRMPGKSGLEVLEALRTSNWAMPVILITAFGTPETHDEAKRLGANVILDKPFDLDDLVAAVRRVVPLPEAG